MVAVTSAGATSAAASRRLPEATTPSASCAGRTDALSVKLAYGYGPADDVIAANPVDTWWSDED